VGDEYEYNEQDEYCEPDETAIPLSEVGSTMTASISCFPSTSQMMKEANLTFGMICQPLAHAELVPVVNFGDSPVIRCRNCRGYINPFVEWDARNRANPRWKCSLCNQWNEASQQYYEQFANGERQELLYGSLEIVAPDEYCVRPPQCPTYLFVINVNRMLVESGALQAVCSTVEQVVNEDPRFSEDDRLQIGFITYSDKIHYYSLSPRLSRPRMMVLNELKDSVLPIPPNQILCNLSECRDLVLQFLSMLPSLHCAERCSSENALGSAMECAFNTLKSIGGKIVCFSWGLPTLGKGKLMNRMTAANDLKADYDKLIKRGNNFFMDLSIMMTKYQIGCDLFQFQDRVQERYCDVSTVKAIARCTGGELFFYDGYSDSMFRESLTNDLYKLLSRDQGWESVMRIRTSRGIRIDHYYGCFYRRAADLLALPNVDPQKSIAIIMHHDGNGDSGGSPDSDSKKGGGNVLINEPAIYVQSALLYTNSNGQRRIRVCTKQIAVTSSYEELFANVNLPVLCSVVAKEAVFKLLAKDLASSRMYIQERCVSALQGYVRCCGGGNGLETEDDYPLSLRFLPLMTLGLLKCAAFGDITDLAPFVHIDRRISLIANLLHINPANLELLMRPPLYRVDELLDVDEEMLSDEYFMLPEHPLTIKSLKADGIFLLDNGQTFFIVIGSAVDSTVRDTFIDSTAGVKLKGREENVYVEKLWVIMDYLQSINYRYRSMEIITPRNSRKIKEFGVLYMIRDRTDSVMSYDEFFAFLSKQTRRGSVR